MRTTVRFAVLAALILLVLVACSGGPSAQPSSSSPVGSEPGSSATSPSQAPRSLTLEIKTIEGYTARGTVVIDIAGESYTMTVSVLGLLPNSRHLLNMHYGTCARPILELAEVVNLGDVQADAAGQGTFTTPLYAFPYTVPSGGRILTVHNEPLKRQPGDAPVPSGHIACADLTN